MAEAPSPHLTIQRSILPKRQHQQSKLSVNFYLYHRRINETHSEIANKLHTDYVLLQVH